MPTPIAPKRRPRVQKEEPRPSDFNSQLNEMIKNGQKEAQVTLTNGIIIQTKPISQDAIRRIIDRVDKPTIPVVFIDSRDREEENPNDPDYLDALEKYHSDILNKVYDAMFILGTSCAYVPEDYYKPESEEWVQFLGVAGIEINNENKFTRYRDWLKLYACSSQFDYFQLTSVLYRRVGVMEKEVIDAIGFFRSREDGGAIVELPIEGNEFGDNNQANDTGDSI